MDSGKAELRRPQPRRGRVIGGGKDLDVEVDNPAGSNKVKLFISTGCFAIGNGEFRNEFNLSRCENGVGGVKGSFQSPDR